MHIVRVVSFLVLVAVFVCSACSENTVCETNSVNCQRIGQTKEPVRPVVLQTFPPNNGWKAIQCDEVADALCRNVSTLPNDNSTTIRPEAEIQNLNGLSFPASNHHLVTGLALNGEASGEAGPVNQEPAQQMVILDTVRTNNISIQPAETPVSSAGVSAYAAQALKSAEFLLNMVNADGAIVDQPGGQFTNLDSNMEYALIGLAAAYWYTQDMRYLTALERGIDWLAARQVLEPGSWRGSWYYAYQSFPPYQAVALSPGSGVMDVRGVDATSALFVYLLYLHKTLSGSTSYVERYATNAMAALVFVMSQNRDPINPFFYSSWQLKDNAWTLWRFQYSADQGDVYLGLAAGARLFDGVPGEIFTTAALELEQNLNTVFFDQTIRQYAVGRSVNGTLANAFGSFSEVFPQGYLPWIFGPSPEALLALAKLESFRQTDGSLMSAGMTEKFSLSNIVYILAASRLNKTPDPAIVDWLLNTTYDPETGGIRDTDDPASPVFSNVIGFAVTALLGMPAFLSP